MSMLNGSTYNEFPQGSSAVLPMNLTSDTNMGQAHIGMFEKQSGGSRRRKSKKSTRGRGMKGGSGLEYGEYSSSTVGTLGNTLNQPLLQMPIASLSTGGKRRKLVGGMINSLSPAVISQTMDNVSVIPVVPITSTNLTEMSNAPSSIMSITGGKKKSRKSRKMRKTKKSRKSKKNFLLKIFGK